MTLLNAQNGSADIQHAQRPAVSPQACVAVSAAAVHLHSRSLNDFEGLSLCDLITKNLELNQLRLLQAAQAQAFWLLVPTAFPPTPCLFAMEASAQLTISFNACVAVVFAVRPIPAPHAYRVQGDCRSTSMNEVSWVPICHPKGAGVLCRELLLHSSAMFGKRL